MIDWADIMVDKAALIRLQQTDPIPLDIDIGCHPGEIFVLVGASGSGKTFVALDLAFTIARGVAWRERRVGGP